MAQVLMCWTPTYLRRLVGPSLCLCLHFVPDFVVSARKTGYKRQNELVWNDRLFAWQN